MEPADPGSLASRTCIPCRGGVPPLTEDAVRTLMPGLHGDWHVVDGKRLEREFRFKDFRRAMALVQAIGAIAEEQRHHPDLCFGWAYVRVSLQTHVIGGLHDNDFILAARIDGLPPAVTSGRQPT
jgi:4a-hydroxytetrahydrobiopterin dehydratase